MYQRLGCSTIFTRILMQEAGLPLNIYIYIMIIFDFLFLTLWEVQSQKDFKMPLFKIK